MDETNPSGLFLVTSGSKGDRLLFRYPYEVPGNRSSLMESKMRVSFFPNCMSLIFEHLFTLIKFDLLLKKY